MKKILASMAAGLAGLLGSAHAVTLDFESFASFGGLVNINPLAPYFEDGFIVTPENGEAAIFDASADTDFIGHGDSSFLGFQENNEITIVREGGGRFNMTGILAGPSTLAASQVVNYTVVGYFAGGGRSVVTFALDTATELPLQLFGIVSMVIYADDDAALDQIQMAAVPVPAGLPLFAGAAAAYAAWRRKRSA